MTEPGEKEKRFSFLRRKWEMSRGSRGKSFDTRMIANGDLPLDVSLQMEHTSTKEVENQIQKVEARTEPGLHIKEKSILHAGRVSKSDQAQLEKKLKERFGDTPSTRLLIRFGLASAYIALSEGVDYTFDSFHFYISDVIAQTLGTTVESFVSSFASVFLPGLLISYGLIALYDWFKVGAIDVYKIRKKDGTEKSALHKFFPALFAGAVFPSNPDLAVLYMRKGVNQFNGLRKSDHAFLWLCNATSCLLYNSLFWGGSATFAAAWWPIAGMAVSAVILSLALKKVASSLFRP